MAVLTVRQHRQMNANLAFEVSLTVAKEHIAAREYEAAWLALERAYEFGRARFWRRLRCQWWMLVCRLAPRGRREVVGQRFTA